MFRLVLLAFTLALPAQAQTLQQQFDQINAVAQKYADLRAARREGWRPFGGEVPLMGRHYQNKKLSPDLSVKDRIDFAKPANLVYATINGRQKLVALAYVVRRQPGEPMPVGFATSRDVWHVHDAAKILGALSESRPLIGAIGSRWFNRNIRQGDGRSEITMVHVWLIDNPKGRFASHNPRLAYLDLGLPDQRANDFDTARGLALLQKNGCGNALDAHLWLAGASFRKSRQIKSACRDIAAEIRAAAPSGIKTLEKTAKVGWRRLEDIQFMTLSDAERKRISALVEPGPGVCN